jgi:hypothetical protein
MIIEIDEALFNKVAQIVKGRNLALYEQLMQLQPLQNLNTLSNARMIKTDRIKEKIKSTIEALEAQNITPNKYQVHKVTNIAYVTLNKYFDVIMDEVRNDER